MAERRVLVFRKSELFFDETGSFPHEVPPFLLDSVVTSCVVDKNESSQVVAVLISEIADTGLMRGTWIPLRSVFARCTKEVADRASRALGILNWLASMRYCSRCASPLADHPAEIARICPECGTLVYPRISPAIIVLVHRGSRVLLARHVNRNTDVFTCIAGYVEHGESLEEAVAREVFEETALRVENVRYAGSQSWPFPDQYMIAFHAEWESGEIEVNPAEISQAIWFDRDALPPVPGPGTIAWRLIHGDLSVRQEKTLGGNVDP